MDKKGNMTSQKSHNISSILECDEVIDEMPENDFNRIDIRSLKNDESQIDGLKKSVHDMDEKLCREIY